MKSPLIFDSKKLACSCCGQMEINAKFLNKLSTIQFGLGKELAINSGYRCAKHNAEVGGAKDSRHMLGIAADISCVDVADRWQLVSLAVKVDLHGIGVGKNFIHLDDRVEDGSCWTYPIVE